MPIGRSVALADSLNGKNGDNGEIILLFPGTCSRLPLQQQRIFEKKILEETRDNASPVATFLSEIGNYMISVKKDESNDFYIVEFHSRRFKGEFIKGGGGAYKIDGVKFNIIEKEYFM
ncbi:hypothetical protein [Methylococcus sp. Mc7]|uniref:hypothetical protein n=1 Tax=Methylococcus sp. Mc7 TaxID=2860258 RepID=UPI001C52F02E|nr:hypothetical protein [Methylococcus sp. Mc7]QXP85192.1 hypothetical protein KW115_05545 [Methylococcus sp. Mc7]